MSLLLSGRVPFSCIAILLYYIDLRFNQRFDVVCLGSLLSRITMKKRRSVKNNLDLRQLITTLVLSQQFPG